MILEGCASATGCVRWEIKIILIYIDWEAAGIEQTAAEANQSLTIIINPFFGTAGRPELGTF
jgi:hypothetical protein